jgi:putative PIN family toxin of toxin-antitoxin system
VKVVLDSNVIVAAFAARGLCGALFELCLDRHTIILSDFILTEVRRAFAQKLKMPKHSIGKIESYLREVCVLSSFDKITENICRDKDDNNIIALAVSAKADFIITGDKDLLVLKKYQFIRIVSPREFWEVERYGENNQ